MFQMATWLSYSDEFGTTRENIKDDELQQIVAIHMLNNGGWRHWYTCAKKVTKKMGAYPVPDTSS